MFILSFAVYPFALFTLACTSSLEQNMATIKDHWSALESKHAKLSKIKGV